MSVQKKGEARISLNSPIITVTKQTQAPRNRKGPEYSTQTSKTKPTELPFAPRLPPYTPPPDTLILDLCHAIDAKAWKKAKKYAHELIFYDPWRADFHDLYHRIDEIIQLLDMRMHPKFVVISRESTASETGMSKFLANIKFTLDNL